MKNKKIFFVIAIAIFAIFIVYAPNVLAAGGESIPRVTCGDITGIPKKIPHLTSLLVTVAQIAIPVVLVIMGSLDLFKGITAQDEKEIKKGQQLLIKRLIVAAIVFFVVVIVKMFVSLVAESSTTNIVECIDCFISNDCKEG